MGTEKVRSCLLYTSALQGGGRRFDPVILHQRFDVEKLAISACYVFISSFLARLFFNKMEEVKRIHNFVMRLMYPNG